MHNIMKCVLVISEQGYLFVLAASQASIQSL